MQFKHPELLWALFLLLIPIFVHLFQLRRFKKTPFTNVAMLQKVVQESRKSKSIKKWLLLFTRMILLAALVLAFAQPFKAKLDALKQQENVIYLDNSFSMQAKMGDLPLLEKAVQELSQQINENETFSIFTNTAKYAKVTLKEFRNRLLSIEYSANQLDLAQIQLTASTLFSKDESTSKNLILISDLQGRTTNTTSDARVQSFVVPMRPDVVTNIAIDSVYIQDALGDTPELVVLLSGGSAEETTALSLSNGTKLIGKAAASFDEQGTSKVLLSIPPREELTGTLQLVDNGLRFDNNFYFSINRKEKINVLAISEGNSEFLSRIFTSDEFAFTSYGLKNVNYSDLEKQNLVIVNGLARIPESLQRALKTFSENGGNLLVIPGTDIDLNSYNALLSSYQATQLQEGSKSDKNITSIQFEHPIYRNVFERKVANFQYPKVSSHYTLQTNAPTILGLQGGAPFLSGQNGFYCFSASLDAKNTNFLGSPLIVPTLYNMGVFSLRASDLYHVVGDATVIELPVTLGKDAVIRVAQEAYEFIPLQQSFTNKVRLRFTEEPQKDGLFQITKQGEKLRSIGFNYPRTESKLTYLDPENLANTTPKESVASLFDYLASENEIIDHWKWFIILALAMAVIEVLIQKFIS